MFGLHFFDFLVLCIYLIGITGMGIMTAKWVKKAGDFIMPRRFGKSMMIMHAFGTGTHSDQAVSVASKTFSSGLSGIWYQWLWLFVTPFYWLIAPLMRRFRAQTTADVFELRYNRSVAILFAAVGILQLTVNIGVMLKGAGAVVKAGSGGMVSSNLAIVIMTVMFVIYGMAGGLSSAIITDFVQGLLTIVFSFLLLPFVLSAVGGMSGLHESISDPHIFSLVAPDEITVFYIVIIALNGLVGIVTQPHVMGNCAACRSEMDGRVGFTVGNFLKRICTVAWCLTGLAGIAYFAGQSVPPDEVFGRMASEFLPRIMPGLLGLFMASLLAAVMSSCDSFMIASSGLFTENIYRPLKKGMQEKHYTMVARIASLVIVAGGVIFAFWLPGVVAGLKIFWKISPMMGIAFWLGLFWRRANSRGAWASTLTGFAVWFLTTKAFFIDFVAGLPFNDTLRLVVNFSGKPEIYLPWQMIFYLSAGLAAGIIVSLRTNPEAKEKLERYYSLLRTPATGEENISGPCTLPDDALVPPRRNLFKSENLEIPIPNLSSIVGFIGGLILVGIIIFTFVLIVH